MLNRHEYRERIVFALYQHLLLRKDLRECFENNIEPEDFDDFTKAILEDLLLNKKNYIEKLSVYLVKWSFDRLNLVEQAILLASTSELLLRLNDNAIVIDEAIRITKKYCDEDSYKYINGVLDSLCKN